MAKQLLDDETRKQLKENFTHLHDDVDIAVFVGEAKNAEYDEISVGLIREFAEVEDKIKPRIFKLDSPEAKKYAVKRSPTILVAPDKYGIRFTGSPLGEEGRSFVLAIIMASTGTALLEARSKERIAELKEKRHVRVFVSPS